MLELPVTDCKSTVKVETVHVVKAATLVSRLQRQVGAMFVQCCICYILIVVPLTQCACRSTDLRNSGGTSLLRKQLLQQAWMLHCLVLQ
jgi:hypothetical protein